MRPRDVIPLETIRLGLRSETLLDFEPGYRRRYLSMRESRDVFHLAIPAYDLDQTVEFYVTKLGCKLARRYDDRVTFDFFGDQLVCHLSEAPAVRTPMNELPMYPRHFGVTFREQSDFDELYQLCQQRDVPSSPRSVCASKAALRCIRRSSRVTRRTIFWSSSTTATVA